MSKEVMPEYFELLFSGEIELAQKSCEACIKNSSNLRETLFHKMNYCHILNENKEFERSENILTELYRETNDFMILHNLGAVWRMQGKFEKALNAFEQETEKLQNSKSVSDLDLATNLYELAKTKHMLNRFDDALIDAYYSLKFAKKSSDPIMHGCAYRILGDLFSEVCHETANVFFDKATKWFEKGADPRANQEIQLRKDALLRGEDPKYIS